MKQNLYDGTLDKDARVLLEKDDSIAYHVQNNDGELSITEHHVFPGIWLIYKHAHAQKYRYPPDYPSGLLEITHCREGRFEYQAGDRIFYLSEGDVSVGNSTDAAVVYCPTRHYRGVSVILDPALAPRCLSCFLDDVNVSPFALLKKFCGENKHFIMRSTSQLEHIFSEIYSVPEHLKKGYLKVKILELLLFLSDLDPKLSQSEQRCCTKAQVELAKQVCGFINANMNIRLTIEQLAARFFVSPAQPKKCFYSVYGESVYAYIRAYKMRSAAHRLKTTDQTISEIANDFGYDNSSKFSKAFRHVMGASPTEYRQGNTNHDA